MFLARILGAQCCYLLVFEFFRAQARLVPQVSRSKHIYPPLPIRDVPRVGCNFGLGLRFERKAAVAYCPEECLDLWIIKSLVVIMATLAVCSNCKLESDAEPKTQFIYFVIGPTWNRAAVKYAPAGQLAGLCV